MFHADVCFHGSTGLKPSGIRRVCCWFLWVRGVRWVHCAKAMRQLLLAIGTKVVTEADPGRVQVTCSSEHAFPIRSLIQKSCFELSAIDEACNKVKDRTGALKSSWIAVVCLRVHARHTCCFISVPDLHLMDSICFRGGLSSRLRAAGPNLARGFVSTHADADPKPTSAVLRRHWKSGAGERPHRGGEDLLPKKGCQELRVCTQNSAAICIPSFCDI